MVSWTFHLFLLLGLVGSDIIRQNLNILPINPSNIKNNYTTSMGNQWRSFKEKSQYPVDRSRCSKGWQRFGGSCYHLSNVTSTSIKANKTCKRHYLNNSQLMQILDPFEIDFAAYILNKNNLSELLVQINPHLSKDNKFVKFDIKKSPSAKNKLRQKLRTNYSRKAKRSAQSQVNEGMDYENLIDDITDTQIDSHSPTLITNENDYLKEEEFDDIPNICDKLSWNAVNSDTDVFLLIISKDLISNKIICSINDIESNRTYPYMCQYVFDFCFGNDQCGHHGRCVNNPSGFNCSCYFYMEGPFCKEISTIFIHLVIGIFIVGFFFILEKSGPQNYQRSIIKKITDYFQKQPITFESTSNCKNNTDINVGTPPPSETQQDDNSHPYLTIGMMFLIYCCLSFIPAYCHWNIFQSDSNDQLKFDLLINDTVQLITQCENHFIWQADSYTLVGILLTCCLILFFWIQQKNSCLNTGNDRTGCLSPIQPFTLANRWETAALCGLVVLDVLIALEHFFLDLDELWNQSVLIQFVKRTFIPVLYGIGYCPLFMSLQQRDRYVRGVVFFYILCNIIYIIIRQSSCMDFLSLSKNYSPLEEAKHRLELGNWSVIYGLIKSMPQFILLSYIGAEFLLRVIFDSRYPSNMKILNNSESDSSYWSKIPKCIYQWDKNFRYTTMAMCSYTVAFVLLYYLTCVFAFQFLMGMSSMSFIRFCLENIFNIEMKTWSFRYEILLTAFLIFLIFAHRFLKVMMKYKEHTNDLKNDNYEEIPRLNEKEQKSIAVKSIGYLSSIFLSIVGGFFIWFHIILFIIIIIFRTLSFCVFNPELPRIELIFKLVSIILPMFVLYGLKKYITEWLCTFISVDPSSNRNKKFNEKFYGILVYFTFLIGCHIAVVSTLFRLIKGILYNILLIPQVDSSHFGQKYQKKDSVFMAYVSFLYMERGYRLAIESRSQPNSVQDPTNQVEEPFLGGQMTQTDPNETPRDPATQPGGEGLTNRSIPTASGDNQDENKTPLTPDPNKIEKLE